MEFAGTELERGIMPEGRMLKKRISDSKRLGALRSDSARLLYTWLLPHLDVEGRYSADPDLIKGHIFPKVKSMTLQKINKLLYELAEQGLIILYKSDGEIYLNLKKFHEFQKIDREREAKSKIPAPRKDTRLTLENSRVDHENSSISLSKVNESKVKEKTEDDSLFEKQFDEFWKAYPKKVAKDVAKDKFMTLAHKGKLKELTKAFHGYLDYLKYQRIEKNFDQEPLNPATFLYRNRWKDYIDFKYEAQL